MSRGSVGLANQGIASGLSENEQQTRVVRTQLSRGLVRARADIRARGQRIERPIYWISESTNPVSLADVARTMHQKQGIYG